MICFDVFSLWFLMHGVHGDNCRGSVLEAPELGLPQRRLLADLSYNRMKNEEYSFTTDRVVGYWMGSMKFSLVLLFELNRKKKEGEGRRNCWQREEERNEQARKMLDLQGMLRAHWSLWLQIKYEISQNSKIFFSCQVHLHERWC